LSLLEAQEGQVEKTKASASSSVSCALEWVMIFESDFYQTVSLSHWILLGHASGYCVDVVR
jgi:hypothetical protein